MSGPGAAPGASSGYDLPRIPRFDGSLSQSRAHSVSGMASTASSRPVSVERNVEPILLPPIDRGVSPAMSDGQRSTASRSIGVHSMLNPSDDQTEPRGRRRSAAQMEASSTETTPYLHSRPLSRMSSEESTVSDISPIKFESRSNGDGRKILTPRSPTFRRGPTMGQPTGSIDAQQTPFITAGPGRSFPEHSAPQPSLVAIAGYRPPQYPSHKAPTPPLPHNRRPSLGIVPPSAAPSPGGSTSYSYSQGQASPATPFGAPGSNNPTPPGSFQLGPTHAGPLSAIPPQGLDHSAPHSSRSYPGTPTYSHNPIPITASSQSIQVFTISTAKGPVQVPVDVQAASRVADEKRRRNAGASARFRARRKEKEKEASSTISRLERRLRDALEDVEFYRSERDALVELACRLPGGVRECLPRPGSPRRTRREVSGTPTGEDRTDGGSTSPPTYEGSMRDGEKGRDADAARKGEERHTRRRTESYDVPRGSIEVHPPSHPHPGGDKHPNYPHYHPSAPSQQGNHEPLHHSSFAPPSGSADQYSTQLSQPTPPRYGAPPPAFTRHGPSPSAAGQSGSASGERADRPVDGTYRSYGEDERR